MTESDARRLVEKELSAAGLDDAYALTLFGGKVMTILLCSLFTQSNVRERRTSSWRGSRSRTDVIGYDFS